MDTKESGFMLEKVAGMLEEYGATADVEGVIPDGFLGGVDIASLNRMLLPPDRGGHRLAQTALGRVSIYSKLGAADPGLTIALPGPGLALPPMLSLASARQRSSFFDLFDRDQATWGAFAITEPDAGSDATALATTAVDRGDHFIVNGTKCFITNGARASTVIVFATTNPALGRFGVRAFMVDADTPGFSVDRKEDMLGLRASQLAVLSFRDCVVPRENLLGDGLTRGDSFKGAQASWDYMRPLLSSLIVGTADRIFKTICRLAACDGSPGGRLSRSVSGSALSGRIQMAWQLVLKAAWVFDRQNASPVDASMAKAAAASVASEVAHLAAAVLPILQVDPDGSLERFIRNAKAFDILEGTGDMQRLMIAKMLGPSGRSLTFDERGRGGAVAV